MHVSEIELGAAHGLGIDGCRWWSHRATYDVWRPPAASHHHSSTRALIRWYWAMASGMSKNKVQKLYSFELYSTVEYNLLGCSVNLLQASAVL